MLRISLACPKHPRYNPASGEGAIRGACQFCRELFLLYGQYLRVSRLEWQERHMDNEEEL